jgi:polysaccharide pyruvyl transferase WcaK-like protein
VLVADCWLANAGDAAIAIATDRLVRHVAPSAAVLHAAYGSDLLATTYPELALVPPLDALLGIEGAASLPADWSPRAAAAITRDADVVLSQGGGFLIEAYQPWTRIAAHAEVLRREIPLMIVGQTIGRFDAASWRSLLGHVLRASQLVAVRDPGSMLNALELGADPSRVALTSDLTLTLFDTPPPDAPHRGVGVVLSGHQARLAARGDGLAESTAVLRAVVDAAPDEAITLFSTVQGLGAHGLEDDLAIAEAAAATLEPEERRRVRVVDGHVSACDAVLHAAAQRAVVTQRLHPGIFALASGVPAALLVGSKLDVLHGVALDTALVPHGSPVGARRAIRAVLDPTARRGRRLWSTLEPARVAAARTADRVHACLRALGWPVVPGAHAAR